MRTILLGFSFLLATFKAYALPIQLLLERDADAVAGNEVFLASFASYQDLVDSNVSASTFSQVNIASNFSVGGFAFDGLAYQLLLERDADSGAGSEVFLASFSSYQDLVDGNVGASIFSQVDIASNFSLGGFAFDGLAYQLLLERDADSAAGSEVFLASFGSYQDLVDGNVSASTFSQVDIASNFSVGGFSYDLMFDLPNPVSVPTTLALCALGLAGMGFSRRRTVAQMSSGRSHD